MLDTFIGDVFGILYRYTRCLEPLPHEKIAPTFVLPIEFRHNLLFIIGLRAIWQPLPTQSHPQCRPINMTLPHPQSFSKMHGLGNDFVVISALQSSLSLTTAAIRRLSDRHLGIGFDQLLIVEHGKFEHGKTADFFCRIFNADGSEAEQCGNGLRCVARFVHEYGLTPTSQFKIATKAGVFPIAIQDYDHISVTLHVPLTATPMLALNLNEITQLADLTEPLTLHTLSLGNPHAIIRVAQLDSTLLTTISKALAHHPHFPHGVNLGLMAQLDRNNIRLITHERGAGLTHACGSNALAATLVGIANDWLDHNVNVHLTHGQLTMQWDDTNEHLTMTGPATYVFAGSVVVD